MFIVQGVFKMARMVSTNKIKPTVIDKFLGLRLDTTGDTQLKLGESGDMNDFKITENFKLRKRPGYRELFSALGSTIQGAWHGRLSGTDTTLFACNNFVYFEDTLSGTDFDSLDTSTYTNVDVVKTTALTTSASGTTGADDVIRLIGNSEFDECTQANIDLVASVGKYYFHTDETVWIIVFKGAYASIATARTSLGSLTCYYPVGAVTDAPVDFFGFDDKVYLVDGTEYMSWDGTGLFADVVGYRPLIATATPPAGGGTLVEPANSLTGKKRQKFSPDGIADDFVVAETSIGSIDAVYLNSVLQTVTTHYTVNLTTGTVTFVSTPASGTNTVEIYWTKGTGTRTYVTTRKYAMIFGGENDIRVHMWTGADNIYIYSELADGDPSAEYFPELYFNIVGSAEYPITDIVRQYDRQVIFKQNEQWYAYYDAITDSSGATTITFPVFPLNDVKGNVAKKQVRIIQNNPYAVFRGVQETVGTNVRDERNVTYISKRVQPDLDDVDLSTAKTTDWEEKWEYWLCVGNTVWIHNYRLDMWYRYYLNDTPTVFFSIDRDLYFGTDAGEIMKVSTDYLSDNGTVISAKWDMNFYNFGADWLRKNLYRYWVGMQPEGKSYARISLETDNGVIANEKEIAYDLQDFGNIDFSDFSFETNYNPKPFRLKHKAKKFVYLKMIIESDTAFDKCTITSIDLKVSASGESR